jgi:hypothetical protein
VDIELWSLDIGMHYTKILEKLDFDMDICSVKNTSMYKLSYSEITQIRVKLFNGNVWKTSISRMIAVTKVLDVASHTELMNRKTVIL